MKLQDYAHYYIGAPCILYMADDDPAGYHTDLDYDTIKKWFTNQEETDIKPLLRRLEDMTEEEGVEMFGTDRYWDIVCKEGKWDLFSSKEFHYLLQRHFDLFGLIPAGLAVDIKTIDK